MGHRRPVRCARNRGEPRERPRPTAPAALADAPALADPTDRRDFTRHRIRRSGTVPRDTHLANIASHSGFLVLGEEAATALFLTEERAHLRRLFPTEPTEETYDVDLLVPIRP